MSYSPPNDPYQQASPYPTGAVQSGPSVTYASWIQRVGGLVIDVIPTYALILIGSFVDGPSINLQTGQQSSGGIIYWLANLAALAFGIYNRFYLGGTTGQTLGRRSLGIKLVGAETGQPIGIGLAFARDLCHAADSLACLVGWLFPLWDAKRQTFADKIIKTVVVK